MTNGYQQFPIYDFKAGLILSKDPWLLPKDAFPVMSNMYLDKGVMKKTQGYREWGRFVNGITDEALSNTVDTQLTYSGTLAQTPIRPGDLVISTAGDGETFTDTADTDGYFVGVLAGNKTPAGSGTINYLTGAWSITYGSNPGAAHAITAVYSYYAGLPIMGMPTYYDDAGNSQFLVQNTKRINVYNPTTGKLNDLTETDVFTGDDNNFFWYDNWKERLFITNNIDRVKTYDGATLANLLIDIDNDTTNEVDTCLLIFFYKGHLILLRTMEDGVSFPQRARWSNSNSYTDWYGGSAGFVDCPTIDWIMGADFIGDDLIVIFEKSVWILKYTGDPLLPFEWQQIKSTEGCSATFSLLPFADEILFLGATSIMGTDALDIYNIDQKIPDFSLNFNQSAFQYVYGSVVEELRQAWLAFPSASADLNDTVLMLNYEEGNFATFALPIHCLGYYKVTDEPLWDDYDVLWDDLDMFWDEKSTQAGYPISLGGTHDGILYQLNYGGSWQTKTLGANGWTVAETSIPFSLYSGELNPFSEQGQKARLGFIDFLVNKDEGISFFVDFYVDGDTNPYKTAEVTCDGGAGTKVWKRVFAGAEGAFHQLQLRHVKANQTLNIHAMNFYLKPSGRIT